MSVAESSNEGYYLIVYVYAVKLYCGCMVFTYFLSYFTIKAPEIDCNWNMKSNVLELTRFVSPHDGNHVWLISTDRFSNWELTENFVAITSGNCSEMCRGMELLGSNLNRTRFHVRYMAHVFIIVVKSSFQQIHKNIGCIRRLVGAIWVTSKRREKLTN